eukprot:gene20781-27605_t
MASLGKPMSRSYMLAKFFSAAEEFTHQIVQHRQQVVAKNLSWNPSDAISSAMNKFKEVWKKEMTTTMYIAGAAMSPALNARAMEEDKFAVEKLVVRLIPRPTAQRIMLGDVVALRSPLGPSDDDNHVMIRRVAALEGTEMSSDNEDDKGFEIPKGHCWVLADNVNLRPPQVIDSRTFGFIRMDSILGRVIYSAASATKHGPVKNNVLSVVLDRPVFEQEVDVDKLFPEDATESDTESKEDSSKEKRESGADCQKLVVVKSGVQNSPDGENLVPDTGILKSVHNFTSIVFNYALDIMSKGCREAFVSSAHRATIYPFRIPGWPRQLLLHRNGASLPHGRQGARQLGLPWRPHLDSDREPGIVANIPIGILAGIFLLLSAVDHLIVTLPFFNGIYNRGLANNIGIYNCGLASNM